MKRPSLLERIGWAPRRKGRSVIVWVRSGEDLHDVSGLIAELVQQHPRVNFLLVGEADRVRCPPEFDDVLCAPFAFRATFALFFTRTRPQAILLVGTSGSPVLWQSARRHNIHMHVMPRQVKPLKAALNAAILDTTRKYTGVSGRLLRLPGVTRLSRRSLAPIRDLATLAKALGHPRRILCLGNGPSSEADEVRALATSDFDAVFRVNHRWVDRGLFTRPDMVFAAGSKPVRRVAEPCIFCVQDEKRAGKVRLACLHLGRGKSLAVAEDLSVLGDWQRLEGEGFGGFAPTNGAVMLSVARALRPRHITVAGVDLFSDPHGAYPGDASTANAYGVFHNREKEREFTLRWIEASRADNIDVRLIGAALGCAWRDYSSA